MNRPPSYQGQPHTVIPLDKECTLCPLGQTRHRHNQEKLQKDGAKDLEFCVGGAGPEDLSQVKLIVFSDYPGHYECLYEHPQVDIIEKKGERKKGLVHPYNSGAMLRMGLNLMFGLDTYNDCYMTNAVRCSPGNQKVIDAKHLKPCLSNWVRPEFRLLDELIPTVPLLVAGQVAFRAICQMYQLVELTNLGLNGCRRREDIIVGQRPTAFTYNPAIAARCQFRIETQVKQIKGITRVTRNEWLYPPLPGSMVDLFIKDLSVLAPYLNNE